MTSPTLPKDDDGIVLPFERLAPNRRAFLRLAGFGVAAAFLEGCSRAPDSRLVVPAKGPAGVVPGRAYRIATVCDACPAGCGVLATCKDGRPVKLEGLPDHPTSRGGLCAQGQADVLAMYDSKRFSGPRRGADATTWAETDRALVAAFDAIARTGGKVRVLTGTRGGPTEARAIERFLGRFKDARHVVYDALSASALADAHALTHGVRAIPEVRIDRAEVLVGFEADLFGAWLDPVAFAAGRTAARRGAAEGRRPRHWQFEARVSPTGDCSDERRRLAPWEIAPALVALRDAVRAGDPARVSDAVPQAVALRAVAADLLAAKGRALVVCGANDVDLQTVVNEINERCGAYGATLDLARPWRGRLGDDAAAIKLRDELAAGEVEALIVAGCNPAYDFPAADGLGGLLRRAKLLVATAPLDDETSALADWVCPEPHALESWGDAEPVAGVVAVRQPCAPPLRDARTLSASLAAWSGEPPRGQATACATRGRSASIRASRRRSISTPSTRARSRRASSPLRRRPPRRRASGRTPCVRPPLAAAPAPGRLGVQLYATVAMGDGRHAHNPWLHELPDPVTRVVWDNYASFAPATAGALGIADGDVVRLLGDDGLPPLELPARLQPGQHPDVVAVALGYGRRGTGRFSIVGPEWWEARPTVPPDGVVGVSASAWRAVGAQGASRDDARTARIEKTGRKLELASVQEHHTLEIPPHLASHEGEARDAARKTTVAALAAADTRPAAPATPGGTKDSLWPADHAPQGRSFAMTVDLDLCTGCGACAVACQAENNIPVVGRDEVLRHREMSWIRIDRYASGDGDDLSTVRQPMMCQHCANAPCEVVCPVLATVHSEDGLNQQVYNRCVGTRYCANNCPYKARRFNWFDYPSRGDLENHLLNPDVTVRSRGVMEKCTLCVQRIEDAKIESRRLGGPLKDGAAKTACQQSCPAQAIVFGDLLDPASAVAATARNPRAYRALEETNVAPAVRYLAAVRNPARAN
jgi:Fe-S-cluster-containing dehydrogenase component